MKSFRERAEKWEELKREQAQTQSIDAGVKCICVNCGQIHFKRKEKQVDEANDIRADATRNILSKLASSGYSERYKNEVQLLAVYFKSRLSALGLPTITEAERLQGVDSLKGNYQALVNEATSRWRTDYEYELSYNQVCIAFFSALDDLQSTNGEACA